MIALGKYNTLKVKKLVEFGAYLQGDGEDEILLPKQYMPEGLDAGDDIEVFIYKDSEDRIIATNLKPYAQVGECAYLEVKAVNRIGAFMEWGLMKDLFVPFREQKIPMAGGKKYVVYIYVDEDSDRIAASSHLNKFIKNEHLDLEEGQEVDLLVTEHTHLGSKVVINNRFWGMLYKNEIFQEIHVGERLKGYIKKLREDDKVDVSLQKQGYDEVSTAKETILRKLSMNHGYLPLTDKSDPEDVKESLQMSKKLFKKAIGALYKDKKIALEDMGIRSLEK